ncbi:MAG: TonB-dependent receptor [Methylococcales bacterium]
MHKQPRPYGKHIIKHHASGMILLTALCGITSNASAEHIAIPAGSLATALNRLAENSDLQLVYDTAMTAGKQSPGIQGDFTPNQALGKLLQGTGLKHSVSGDGTILIAAAPKSEPTIPQEKSPSKASAEPPTLKAMTVTADVDNANEDGNGANDPYGKSYTTTNAVAATKTNTAIFDTPMSIQVVPRGVIEDQKSSRIKDALENVSGVRPQSTTGMGTGFIIRGFLNKQTYRNGLIASTTGTLQSEFDTTNIQSIEVLKGPASILYGRAQPGGLINITTKKPLDTPYYSLEQQFGSYDWYRTQWDATGPITQDGSLLYRFTGAYQNSNSFRDFISTDRVNIAPTITWKPTDSTDMTLSIEAMNQDYQADLGVPAIGKRPASIPISRNYSSDPNDQLDIQSRVSVGTEINHRFNKDWAIHSRFLTNFEHADQAFINPIGFQADGRTLDRSVFAQVTDVETYQTNLDLTGNFDIGSTKHQTLVGFDYLQESQDYAIFGEFINPNPDLAYDIFNPRHGINPALFQQAYDTTNFPGENLNRSKVEWYGAYFQDHITLWDKLHIMGGGRYDWAKTGSIDTDSNNPSSSISFRKDEGFSPRVGILYQPIKELGLFGNWTTSFGANNGISATGGSFAPQIGEQFEAGIKTAFFDQRLSATLSYYHLTKSNILTPDLTTPNPIDRAAIGEQRSQGIELDITGQLTDKLSIISSYAFTDARIIKDNRSLDGVVNGFEGKRMTNVPEHSGSLWLKYDLNGYETKEGWSFGLGGILAGQREGDVANSFQMPGFVRMDAFANYKLKVGPTRVTTSFNIKNLLDKDYYESTDPDANVAARNGIYPGAPLTAMGSVKVEF